MDKQVTELKNTCENIQSLLEVVLGMKETKDENIQYEINDDEVPVMQELIPEYATVKLLLKTNSLKVLVYQMVTNRCQEAFENQSQADRNKTKREHNRNKQVVENFIMFMKDFPMKPDSLLEMRQWKHDMQNAINVGYESLKECVVSNKISN